ncbi:MAG: hypothetical protein WDZ91_05220 [Paenibacillaceae bacterium]
MSENKEMSPVSGEKVEAEGIYSNEWGREELMKHGDRFPSDLMMGNTEWELTELPSEDQQEKIDDPSKDMRDKHLHIRRNAK